MAKEQFEESTLQALIKMEVRAGWRSSRCPTLLDKPEALREPNPTACKSWL